MIRFSSGLWLNRESLQQGGFGPLASTIFGFAQSLKALDTDEAEFAMLSAICLISGGKLLRQGVDLLWGVGKMRRVIKWR